MILPVFICRVEIGMPLTVPQRLQFLLAQSFYAIDLPRISGGMPILIKLFWQVCTLQMFYSIPSALCKFSLKSVYLYVLPCVCKHIHWSLNLEVHSLEAQSIPMSYFPKS